MWQRIKTAVILVIIVGVALFASDTPWLFVPLLAVGVTIAAHEWTKLMPAQRKPMHFVLLVLLLTMISLLFPKVWLIWWLMSVVIWLMALVWVWQYPTRTQWYGRRLMTMGVIILTAAITAMFYLWQQSPWWLMYVFILVWCADSGAYFVGRKFGKTKMAPNVSPNKTMQGLYGGLTVGMGVALFISMYWLKYTGSVLLVFMLLSAMTIMASVLGDLFESMLKRRAGIKDSGTVLPGHGGVLDRIDSLLSAMPIFALGYLLLQVLSV